MGLTGSGLILIAIAWLVQLCFVLKGNKKIQPLFIIIYIVGVFLLAYNGFAAGGIAGAKFELASLIASVIVLIAVLAKK